MAKLRSCYRTAAKAADMIPPLNRRLTARQANIGYDKLTRWLNGSGVLGYDELWRLSVVLGCSTDWMLNDRLEDKPQSSCDLAVTPMRDIDVRLPGDSGVSQPLGKTNGSHKPKRRKPEHAPRG